MNDKKKFIQLMLIILVSIGVIFISVIYSFNLIQNNFTNIDKQLQSENLVRVERYLNKDLKDFGTFGKQISTRNDLQTQQKNGDIQFITYNIFQNFMNLDGTYYLGIINDYENTDSQNKQNILFQNSQFLEKVVDKLNDKIYKLSDNPDDYFLDYIVIEDIPFQLYISPLTIKNGIGQTIEENQTEFLILLREIDDYYVKQINNLIWQDIQIISNPDISDTEILKTSESKFYFDQLNLNDEFFNNPKRVQFFSKENYTYQYKGYMDNNSNVQFVISVLQYRTIDVYLVSILLYLLIPLGQMIIMLIISQVVFSLKYIEKRNLLEETEQLDQSLNDIYKKVDKQKNYKIIKKHDDNKKE